VRICSISVSRIADDPRVRRQVDALLGAGHDVHAVGISGAVGPAPLWPVIEIPAPARSYAAKVAFASRVMLLARQPATAHRVFWSFRANRRFLEAARGLEADLYLANDWRALPIGCEAARATGARLAYDSHEYGVGEFAERRLWRAVFPRYIDFLEREAIGKAAFVSAVGEGIARLLQERYDLPTTPIVIRNVPDYRPMPLRPVSSPVRVLYHGQFLPNRGLEPLVESVRWWRPELSLHLRGYGPRRYEGFLKRLIDGSPARDRIHIHPPARMLDLVPLANESDIGIHPLLATSDQTRFSLPNKLFEYLMAGLAVCVSDLPEMASIVRRYGVGVLLSSTTPDAIAAAVNGIDLSVLPELKARALAAARELCWEKEKRVLVEAVAGVADGPPPDRPSHDLEHPL
jgi:glycosyltransferase involved in cell wall biosynthesis